MEVEEQNKNNGERGISQAGDKQSTKKRKKEKEVAVYGNYRNYYNYRVDKGLVEEDPRIKVLKKEWFEGKDCLDIGCNSGLITITIAKMFFCQSILGVDIDPDRIEDAKWNLRKILNMSKRKGHLKTCTSKEAGLNGKDECVTKPLAERVSGISGDSPASLLFDKVSFRHENFVRGGCSPEDKLYDTIVCFSVTKWIHLNWGDTGLITLFGKIWNLLRPGGIFILEPQPWESYKKNRRVSEITATNYHNIEIKPGDFQDILLDKVGFRRVENLSSNLLGTKTGFNRPILALWK